MKSFLKTALLVTVLPVLSHAQQQQDSSQWNIHAGYWHGLDYSGHVQVREFEHTGTFFDLRDDLGMQQWITPYLGITRNFNSKNSLHFNFYVNRFSGSKLLEQDTWYNGTHLQGNSIANVDKSIFMRMEAAWDHKLLQQAGFEFNLRSSLVYDYLIFTVDAPVYPDSPRNETYENFYRQQLPLPNIGISLKEKIGANTIVSAEASGTWLPRIRTWMDEGGKMWLEQKNFDSGIEIAHRFKPVWVYAGYRYRYFSLFEESGEDTNDFLIMGSGVNFGVRLDL